MKRTTERKWHSWRNGVALTICPSMWRRQRRLCWTSGGGTPLTTPHWPSTARLWRESAALNSSTKITEDLTWTTNTMSLSKKAQQPTLSPPAEKSKSPTTHPHHILQGHHWECADQLHHCLVRELQCFWPQDPPADSEHGCKGHRCPSPIHPGHFPCTMLQQNQQHREGPHPPLPQSLPAPTIRKTVPEHQSPLRQTAQQLFPPGCESPEPKSPRPPLKPHANPYLLKHGPPPSPNTPQPYHTKEKTVWNFFVQFKCATHRWVGLYKPPVVTHSPLCALDTASCLTHNVSLCTCTLFMWSIRIVCIVCIFYLLSLVA